MASPLTMGPNSSGWMGGAQQPPAGMAGETDEFGLQVRPMGLKVQYTFDKENQVNCLARGSQVLPIQALPLDERNWIGIVDLRTCLQAVAQGSPEIVSQPEHDFTVYAFDYSEPDTPLVGQGMLSWALEAAAGDGQKMVTGRVTKNMFAAFGKGVKETLEVKLRLTRVAKIQRLDCTNTPTPTDTSEWNAFLHSNPGFGPPTGIVAPQPDLPMHPMVGRPASRPSSVPPLLAPAPQKPMLLAAAPQNTTGASAAGAEMATKRASSAKPSRPASRARAKKEPGRPRGRPPKKRPEGNTSAAEEQPTDADEGPKKKRAKTTKADYPVSAPLDTAPESLRVAASTSGSLRTMRPAPVPGEAPTPSHLQEAPRAPTPVPSMMPAQQRKLSLANKPRRESSTGLNSASFPQMGHAQSQDARSPSESVGQSPDNHYTPADSPADLGSSPPVPRSAAYMHSSPIPSSPVLPPMLNHQPDSGFMSGGLDDVFLDDEDLTRALSTKAAKADAAVAASKPQKATRKRKSRQGEFRMEEPGPPELLPVTSIYNPPYRKDATPAPSDAAPVPQLRRANTDTAGRPQPEVASDSAPPPHSQPPLLERENSFLRLEHEELPLPLEPESSSLPAEHDTLARPVEPENSSLSLEFENSSLPLQHDNSFLGVEEADMSIPEAGGTNQLDFDDLARLGSLHALLFPAPEDIGNPTTTEANRDAAESSQRPPSRAELPRKTSTSGTMPAVPASDPPVATSLTLPPMPPPTAFSEAPCPASDVIDGSSRLNKNLVKKQTIKETLHKAIETGTMPPFCQNCGAIETPTWRKMWTQDHSGVPGYHEYSEKAGQVTAIDILERDADGKPTMYRLVKKALSAVDKKTAWKEMLLCNPCGIWLSKFKSHRPPDRWEKDAGRLNQSRRKRESKAGGGAYNAGSKRARTKSDAQVPTSEAWFMTDPIGPGDSAESPQDLEGAFAAAEQGEARGREASQQPFPAGSNRGPAHGGSRHRSSGPGSTHSRGSGTAASPIPVVDDEQYGATRRLLFPSPRKDGVPKALCEVAVNLAATSPTGRGAKEARGGKENAAPPHPPATPGVAGHDDMHDLFGTPPARPSTPPPKSAAAPGPFKTPTRPTPSHRPITRSVSKSIRSAKSPGQRAALQMLQRTPSKTPSSRRRTPGRHARFDADMLSGAAPFETPFTATLNQLLSEANEFTAGSPSHGLVDLDLSSLPHLDSDLHGGGGGRGAIDFGSYLSTDLVMPSSPPLLRGHDDHHAPADTADESWWSQLDGIGDDGELLVVGDEA